MQGLQQGLEQFRYLPIKALDFNLQPDMTSAILHHLHVPATTAPTLRAVAPTPPVAQFQITLNVTHPMDERALIKLMEETIQRRQQQREDKTGADFMIFNGAIHSCTDPVAHLTLASRLPSLRFTLTKRHCNHVN